MNHTTIFRVLGFVVGGVGLASAGLAAGMALAPARQAANLVEPLSTASLLISADLPSPAAILLPRPTDGRVDTTAGQAAWETGIGTTGR